MASLLQRRCDIGEPERRIDVLDALDVAIDVPVECVNENDIHGEQRSIYGKLAP